MAKLKFWSDTNLGGFVQSIAHAKIDHEVDDHRSEVTVELSDQVERLADDWGGEIVDY